MQILYNLGDKNEKKGIKIAKIKLFKEISKINYIQINESML